MTWTWLKTLRVLRVESETFLLACLLMLFASTCYMAWRTARLIDNDQRMFSLQEHVLKNSQVILQNQDAIREAQQQQLAGMAAMLTAGDADRFLSEHKVTHSKVDEALRKLDALLNR